MHNEDGRHGDKDGRRDDEDGRYAGKGANLFLDIPARANFRLLQTILREFGFSTMLEFLAFQ